MKKYFLPLVLLLLCNAILAQTKQSGVIDGYYPLLRNVFTEDNAYKTTGFVEKRWRIAGNRGFNESIHYVEEILKQAGFKKEVKGEADGPLTYRIETRKMKRPTWEPISSSITLAGDSIPLLESNTNRNMIAINSASTPTGGIMAEIIDVGKGTTKDFEGKDIRGKIIFCAQPAGPLYNLAVKGGAIGWLLYNMPAYTQPEKYIHSIQFSSIPYSDTASLKWGIMLSYDAKEKIKAALAKGKLQANVQIQSNIYSSEELTIVANARGTIKPGERFVFSAHVQEPGANDNATGVGTLAEMASVTAKLIQENKYSPQRTITFLWGDEIVSTGRYIKDDSIRAKGIKWGLSLDMVGEDVTKTSGSFLIEKMPDPSAIWTRGNDKHTEWGGSVLSEADMFPHYYNDFLLDRCRQQSSENGWVVNANPFEGGSDHTPFLQAKIPGLLMWHFTDIFYHTDADRLDMVSAKEMRNVGVSALAAAFTLASADESVTLQLIEEIKNNALDRLQTEGVLSKEAIQKGATLKSESHIIDVWANWYTTALAKMSEINVKGASAKITKQIKLAQQAVIDKGHELNKTLEQH